MTKESLLEAFPNIIRFDDAEDITVGDGWLPLIHRLCEKLQLISKVSFITINAVQIKEKFGGLRFYVDLIDNNYYEINSTWKSIIDDVILEAERRSYSICEECGQFGEIRENRKWIKTLCNKCNQ